MSKLFIEDTSLTAIGDAIRAKGGTTELLSVPDGMVAAIAAIEAGGGTSAGLDIDWENDVVVTAVSAGNTLALPDGYTINDIKLIILPTSGSSSYGSSVRYFFAAPGVLTPAASENKLNGITMGAYGTGSQTSYAGIDLLLIDHQENLPYSTSRAMYPIQLRTTDEAPTSLQGYNVTSSSAYAISYLAVGKALIVLEYKEVA